MACHRLKTEAVKLYHGSLFRCEDKTSMQKLCGGAPIGSADIADLWSLTWLFLDVPAFSGHDCDVADVVVQ